MQQDSLIPANRRPGSGTVNIGNGTASHPGMGGQQYAQPQQQTYTSQAEAFKAFLGGGGSGAPASTAFNWKTHGGGANASPAVMGLLNGTDVDDKNSIDYYLEKVAQPSFLFATSISKSNTATAFYQQFLNVRDNFMIDQNAQTICPARKEFIEDITRYHDFKRIVGYNGSVIFGALLINALKFSNSDDWTSEETMGALQMSIYHVLTLEFVNWLVFNKRGVAWHNRLPTKVENLLKNLEDIKESFSAMWEVQGLKFPYAELSFVKSNTSPSEYRRVFDYEQYGDVFGVTPGRASNQPKGDPEDIFLMIERNANKRNGFVEEPYHNNARQENYDEVNPVITNNRTDLENLNLKNRNQFSLQAYFRNIGKPNHWWIPESDWKHIQRVFHRHPDMRQEEGLGPGVFRIVVMDPVANNGWMSFVVRSEELTVPYVMSSPEKLLPLMEKTDDGDNVYLVDPTPIEEVDKENTLIIPVEVVKEMGKGIPVIAVKEELNNKNYKELITNVDLMANSLTRHIKKQAAVSFNISTWDTFDLKPGEEHHKTRLIQDMPFLFNDVAELSKPSIYRAGIALSNYFKEGIISEGLAKFINIRLTKIVNEWLVNVCGYNAVDGKGGGGKLQIKSFVDDIQDLHDFLEKKDPAVYAIFTDGNRDNYLTKNLKMFYINNPYGEDPAEMGSLDKLKNDICLYVVREFFLVNVVKAKGPYHEEDDVPVYVRRSVFPELFDMVEKTYDMTTDNDFDSTDKLIRYAETGDTWLFSYSMEDKNVATLRHVSDKSPLVILSMN